VQSESLYRRRRKVFSPGSWSSTWTSFIPTGSTQAHQSGGWNFIDLEQWVARSLWMVWWEDVCELYLYNIYIIHKHLMVWALWDHDSCQTCCWIISGKTWNLCVLPNVARFFGQLWEVLQRSYLSLKPEYPWNRELRITTKFIYTYLVYTWPSD
jgi:hypothetical protein